MQGLSRETLMAGNRAVEGNLTVLVNGEQKTLKAFQLIDTGAVLFLGFGDAGSNTGVVFLKFPKNKIGQELQHGHLDLNISYTVNGAFIEWAGGAIKLEEGDAGYTGTLSAVFNGAPSLQEGKFNVTDKQESEIKVLEGAKGEMKAKVDGVDVSLPAFWVDITDNQYAAAAFGEREGHYISISHREHLHLVSYNISGASIPWTKVGELVVNFDSGSRRYFGRFDAEFNSNYPGIPKRATGIFEFWEDA